MLVSVCFGTNDLLRAGEFYDAVFNTIGMVRQVTDQNEIGYGPDGGTTNFWILLPFDGEPATRGNGSQIIFEASSSDVVDQFHRIALEHGGTDEGTPGPRDYAPGYYGAYCRDLDGNKLHIFTIVT